jgi:acyl-CoA thioester hydrolase
VIHRFVTRVHYEDTDMSGLVYHANYLKFIERGRSDWVRDRGIDQRRLHETAGLVFVVARIEADFHAPARFDEVLTVETEPRAASAARLVLAQRVLRDGRRLFSAEVTLAMAGRDGRPVRLPAEIRATAPVPS